MTHEVKKITKIVEELTVYFFSMGSDRIYSEIEKDGDDVVISFRANYRESCRDRLSELEEYLNEPKNEGIEDIYWELAGAGEPGETSQLLLLGMMIDRAEVKLENNFADLKLYKKLLS